MIGSHRSGLAAIAIFKLAKGLLLLSAGFGLLRLLHAEIATLFAQLLEALHVSADSRMIHALILKVDQLQPHTVLLAGLIGLSYGAMLLVEGIGLWWERSWAAYLTVASTSLLLPFELYELVERITLLRLALFLVNVAIVWYLIVQLRRHTLGNRASDADRSTASVP
ncbi:MAG TPA: DUF2127 domain-containing protein [Nitrospira sp.]|nr:DUF2127 domain-containing protein [Nitrospira sp.]